MHSNTAPELDNCDLSSIFEEVQNIVLDKSIPTYGNFNNKINTHILIYIIQNFYIKFSCLFHAKYHDDDNDSENWSDSDCSCSYSEVDEPAFRNSYTRLDDELYSGASMTVREFVLCVSLLKSNTKQPDKHTCLMLKLFAKVLPKPNKCPTSLKSILMMMTIQYLKSTFIVQTVLELIILELPYEERYKLENILLVALWFGDKKPVPNLFLEPLKETLLDLYKGIDFYMKDLNSYVTVRGLILCGTADLPANALFLLMNQYNGRFGCQVCVQEGRTVDRTRTYPFTENIILRTEEEVIQCSLQALDLGKPVSGVKGPSMLSKICPKIIISTAVDAMHCVFEGISKKLGELWFDKKYSNEDFNVSNLIEVIDNKLCAIKPPSYISRRPRPIQSHFAYWKASEQKYWFFYYSLPTLNGILPEDYLNHYQYLVQAVYLLFREKILNEMINLADNLIFEFSSRFQLLYGDKHMTCNVHSIRHLPEVVRRLGPLWTTSCFVLESVNGKMKALVHGSKKPELQIMFNLNIHIKVHTLKYE